MLGSGRFAQGCGAALAGIAPAQAQANPAPPLLFTGIPGQDESRRVKRFGKAATTLEAKLGVPVRSRPVTSHPASVTPFPDGRGQHAWFGGFTGVQARRAVPGSRAIAQAPRTRRSGPISAPTPPHGPEPRDPDPGAP